MNDWLDFRAMTFYHAHEDEYTSYVNEDLKEKLSTSTWNDDAYGMSLFSDVAYNNDQGLLSLTAQYRKDQHKQRDDDGEAWEESESNTLTFGLENTLSLGQFELVVGLANHYFDAEKIADLDGYTEDTLDPMAGLNWTAENGLEIFASIAQKTRFPTFSDMESDGEIYSLDPEKNINYNVGLKQSFFNALHVCLSGFYYDIDDRIGEINDTPANIDKAEIYGTEINTDTHITDRLSLGLDYVFTYARNKSDDRSSDYLEDVPENTIFARLKYLIPVIETSMILKGTYKDGIIYTTENEDKENYMIVGLSLVKEWNNGLSLGGHINNLFDENYYAGKGMGGDGFNCKVVLQYSF